MGFTITGQMRSPVTPHNVPPPAQADGLIPSLLPRWEEMQKGLFPFINIVPAALFLQECTPLFTL